MNLFKLTAKFLTTQRFFSFVDKAIPLLMAVMLACIGYSIFSVFFLTPLDYQQKEAFRIMYVHVPAAALSLGIYSFMALCSATYLIFRLKLAIVFALASAPIGAIFTFIALVTGSLWGKPMWGTYWIWDARLTSELILLFLYLGYILLFDSMPVREKAFKAVSILAVLGFVNIPIIHYSVEWWHTLHQGSSVLKFAKPSIDVSMLWPLISMFIGFSCYTAAVVLRKAQTLFMCYQRDTRVIEYMVKGVKD